MKNGVLYIGPESEYLDQAKISAESVKEHNNVPVAVITSQKHIESAEECSSFDKVISLEDEHFFDDVRDKSENIYKTPFDNTIYLDTDTFVLGDISPVFELLEEYHITAAHAPVRPLVTIDKVPDCFPELNTGVIGFRSSEKVNKLFNKWKDLRDKQINYGRPNETVTLDSASSLEETPFGKKTDQAPFREALYHSDIEFSTLPTEYNFRGSRWSYADVKILHMGHEKVGKGLKNNINEHGNGRTYVSTKSSLYFKNGTTIRLESGSERLLSWAYDWGSSKEYIKKFVEYTGTKKKVKKLYEYIYNHTG